MAKRLSWIAASLLVITSFGTSGASADAFGVSASQTFGLAENQIISVQVSGLPADKGVYVVQCVLSQGKLSTDPKDCTSPQNVGSALWLSNDRGGANPGVAQNFKVLRTVNSKDCATSSCALVSSRDHVDRSDRSFDSITPITVSAISFSVNKTVSLVDAGDELSVSVSGLASDKGIYVRQCELPTDGTRPTKCDNAAAVWASNDASAHNLGAVDAGKDVVLRVKGHFVDKGQVIDCQLTSCGVYLERDWNGLSDRTLDTFATISFAAPVQVKQAVSGWKKSPGSTGLKIGKSLELAKKSLKTKQGNTLTWKTNNQSICKLVQTGNSITVKAVKAGTCLVTAQAPMTSRTHGMTFAWKVKVSK